jgi:hypothetical protein
LGTNEFSKNAKFALVIAERLKLATDEEEVKKWKEFLGCVQQFARPNKETILINDNVWQIPLDSGMRFLAQLAAGETTAATGDASRATDKSSSCGNRSSQKLHQTEHNLLRGAKQAIFAP